MITHILTASFSLESSVCVCVKEFDAAPNKITRNVSFFSFCAISAYRCRVSVIS